MMNILKLMENDIFKIAITHHIYQLCIDVCFDHILKNFPVSKPRVPVVGERFSYVNDTINGDVYHNVEIIKKTDLEIYDEMEKEEQQGILMCIKYSRNVFEDDIIEHDGSQYFTEEEFGGLLFHK